VTSRKPTISRLREIVDNVYALATVPAAAGTTGVGAARLLAGVGATAAACTTAAIVVPGSAGSAPAEEWGLQGRNGSPYRK
jgi:hypothetical protein